MARCYDVDELVAELQNAVNEAYADTEATAPAASKMDGIVRPVGVKLYSERHLGLTVEVLWDGLGVHMRLGTEVPRGVWLCEDEPGKLAGVMLRAQRIMDTLNATVQTGF